MDVSVPKTRLIRKSGNLPGTRVFSVIIPGRAPARIHHLPSWKGDGYMPRTVY
jgi:hypothetical protein